MAKLPTLFKMSATGATQEWRIEALSNSDGTATIRVTYGQKGGKMQTTETVVKAGKNVGRVNATDCMEQAKSEALSKWKKQHDKGYGPSEQVSKPERKPMLAHDYTKHRDKIKFPALIQPKLDGIRCLAHKEHNIVRLVSRANKPIDTVPHINQQLVRIMRDGETWDGELFIKGVRFQTLTSWIKRHQENSLLIEYHVYDCIDKCEFELRYMGVDQRIQDYRMDVFAPENYVEGKDLPPCPIVPVGACSVYSHEDIQKLHDKYVKDGYEGAILRHNNCHYKEGYRSSDLLKIKAFMDDEFPIVGASEGKGKFEGMAIFRLRTKDGAEFDCLPEGTEEMRRAYWTHRDEYVGRLMTVRFFEWTSSNPPLPRFPIGVAIRDEY